MRIFTQDNYFNLNMNWGQLLALWHGDNGDDGDDDIAVHLWFDTTAGLCTLAAFSVGGEARRNRNFSCLVVWIGGRFPSNFEEDFDDG